MIDEERVLWTQGDVECVLIACCTGAELQLRKKLSPKTVPPCDKTVRVVQPDYEIVLRELYPTKSDLYERARSLEAQVVGLEPDA